MNIVNKLFTVLDLENSPTKRLRTTLKRDLIPTPKDSNINLNDIIISDPNTSINYINIIIVEKGNKNIEIEMKNSKLSKYLGLNSKSLKIQQWNIWKKL